MPSGDAPPDNDAFYRSYFNDIVGQVRRNGIRDAEDVATEIFMKLVESERIAKYDPTMVHSYQGTPRKANFRSYTRSLVQLYCRSHRERQYIRDGREFLVCDEVLSTDTSETWLDRNGYVEGPFEDRVLTRVYTRELVEHIYRHMVTVPRRSPRDLCNLPEFFLAWVQQALTRGEVSPRLLCERFKASASSVRAWLKHMHHHVLIALQTWPST